MEKYKNTVLMAILVSETSHIFCCILPTVFSIIGLLSGVGLVSALPGGWVHFHDLLHKWELPMIFFSAAMLAAGWGLYRISKRIDCHDTGCCHGPCGPKKDRVQLILKIATLLFFINLCIYVVFHRAMDISPQSAPHGHEGHQHG